MQTALLGVVALCCCVCAVTAQFTITVPERLITMEVGETAVFTVKPSGSVSSGSWHFGDASIGVWVGTSFDPAAQYRGRVEVIFPEAILKLKGINLTDSGDYRVRMVPVDGTDKTETITLKVLNSVSNIVVTLNVTKPVEYNDTVGLTCTASGTDVSYQWLKDNKPISYDNRTFLSVDNKTLTLAGVLRSDSGNYTCYAYNAVSNSTSLPLFLDINYGPGLPNVSIIPDKTLHSSGTSVKFLCSTDSNPASEFQWFHSGVSLQQNGQEIIINNISMNATGNYTCQAYNNVTLRYNEATREIQVIDPISKPTILSNDSFPVEHNDTVALTCTASGTAVSYLWFKDNETIHSDTRLVLSDDNSTLTLPGIVRSDTGGYTCLGYNVINGKTSDSYLLNVNYGPGDPNISVNPHLQLISSASTVNLSCSAVSNPPCEFQWYFNTSSFLQNGSDLFIPNIALKNTGNYTCQAFNSVTQRYSAATIGILVIDPIFEPVVTSNVSIPVEHIDTVALTCTASGTAVSYLWFKDNETIHSDTRLVLSDDNSTLTIPGILRSDIGEYMCFGYNVINGKTSDSYLLNVNYGPEDPNISVNPHLQLISSASTVNLSCSAESNPPCEFQWYCNTSSFLQNGSDLFISNFALKNTGNYTCQAFNSVTQRYSAATIGIRVVEKITSVNLTANNPKPIEYTDTVTMACAVTGTVESQLWFKDEQALHSSDRITISVDNDTLTIINVTRNDGGTYRCEARNTLSSQSGSHTLNIAYGPDVPELTIAGTHPAELGDSVILSCSAQSHPEAQYKWRFNGTVQSETSPQFTIAKITQADLGIYTCQAHNNITLRDNETTLNVMLNDIPQGKDPNGLSGGAIAGIVIACIVVAALIVALAVWFVKGKGREKSGSNHQNGVTMDATGNIPPSQTEYATVQRKEQNPQSPQQSSRGANTATANRDHEIVYAQPQLLQGHPTAPMTAIVDNKTDYAELKFK